MKLRATFVALLLGLAIQCHAEYGFYLTYRTVEPQGKIDFVWSSSHSDGYDGELPLYVSQPPQDVFLAIRKTLGVEGWDGATGFYNTDYRAAIPGGATKTEEFYVWANPSAARQDIHLYQDFGYLSSGVGYRLSLMSIPSGVTYTGPAEWGPDHGTITLPFYSTSDGLTGYHFQAVITAIPEPASVLALAGGLAGLAGIALKRRR